MGSINFAAPFALLKPVDVDPTRYATEYANLAALAQQRQYRQQEMASQAQQMQLNAVKLEEMQQGLQDQRTMQTLIPSMKTDPQFQDQNGNLDWEGKVLPALQGKISQNSYDALEANILKNHQTHQTILKDQADIDTKAQDLAQKQQDLKLRVNDALANGAIDWREHGSDPAVLEGLFHQWEDLYPDAKGSLENMRQTIAADPGKAAPIMAGLERNLSMGGQQARTTMAETAQKTRTAQAAAAKDQAEADKAAYELTMMKAAGKNDPAAGDAIIDQILPPDKFPTDNPNFKAQLRSAGSGMTDLNQASRERSTVIQSARSLASERSPEALKFEGTKAGVESMARVPGEVAARVQAEQTLAKLSGDAFAGIMDPAERRRAQDDYTKIYMDAGDKVNASRQLRDTIDLARGGNKAAPGVIPIETVRSYLNQRVNAQELKSVSSAAGNWLDQVQGWLDKAVKGQSMPPQILNALDQLAEANEKAALNGADLKRKVLNQTKHSNAPAVPFDPYTRPSEAGQQTVAPIKLKDGRTLTPHDAAAAARFRKDHPELIAP